MQDLERQLQEVKQQLELARSSDTAIDHYTHLGSSSELPAGIPDISRSPRRILRAQLPPEMFVAHSEFMDVGRGLFKPPSVPAVPDNPDEQSLPSASLPTREVAELCLDAYLQSVHRRFPVLFWPQFCRDLWDLYSRDLSLRVLRETVALSFGVLALGALCAHDRGVRRQSESFLTTACAHVDMWTDKIGMNQGIVSFLISIYMYDMNRKSASWVWLAPAIRIAQDRGFHIQRGQWQPVEGEMRRRVWYSLYVWDR